MFFLRVPMVNGSAEQIKDEELFFVKGKQLKVSAECKTSIRTLGKRIYLYSVMKS
jgi:hypothetical protein